MIFAVLGAVTGLSTEVELPVDQSPTLPVASIDPDGGTVSDGSIIPPGADMDEARLDVLKSSLALLRDMVCVFYTARTQSRATFTSNYIGEVIMDTSFFNSSREVHAE
jgi:hypothetical protein